MTWRTACAVVISVLTGFVTWGPATPGAWAQEKSPDLSITVRVSDQAWTYSREQLMEMATETLPNRTGSRKNPAILLSRVLFKDTGLSADQIQMVFVITTSKIAVFRGSDLAYLDRLVLKTGPDKRGQPHHWALAPLDAETYRAIAAHMGSPRKKQVYRIDILPKIQSGG